MGDSFYLQLDISACLAVGIHCFEKSEKNIVTEEVTIWEAHISQQCDSEILNIFWRSTMINEVIFP